ncbi:MAG: Cj0069 family protein [Rubrivivax sp.]
MQPHRRWPPARPPRRDAARSRCRGRARERASRRHPAPGHEGRARRHARPAVRQRRAPRRQPRATRRRTAGTPAPRRPRARQHRGHSGIGVWRVETVGATEAMGGDPLQRTAEAAPCAARLEEEIVDMPALLQRMATYFEPAQGGHMIDQAWQPRLAEGMVRAYLVEDRVTGFGLQAVNALHPTDMQPGPRLYHGPDLSQAQLLKQQLESAWIEQLRQRVGLPREQLPLLWDCDFMLGDSAAGAAQRYVLCEINVSSVSPFPPSSIAPLVEAVKARLAAGQRKRHPASPTGT